MRNKISLATRLGRLAQGHKESGGNGESTQREYMHACMQAKKRAPALSSAKYRKRRHFQETRGKRRDRASTAALRQRAPRSHSTRITRQQRPSATGPGVDPIFLEARTRSVLASMSLKRPPRKRPRRFILFYCPAGAQQRPSAANATRAGLIRPGQRLRGAGEKGRGTGARVYF